MNFLSLIARHIYRHWGTNLAILICFSIGAALLGSLPPIASLTTESSLYATLENSHPSIRNIKVEGPASILTSSLNGLILDSIDHLVLERISVKNQLREIHPVAPIIQDDLEIKKDLDAIWLWSFDRLSEHTIMIEGDWPIVTYPRTQSDALKPPIIQAGIAEAVASDLDIHIGDMLQDTDEYRYLITGILRISDPNSDVWWRDNSSFTISIEPGLNEDRFYAPIFIPQSSMKTYFRGVTNEWRYLINIGSINSSNADIVEQELVNLKNRLSANKANLSSGLPNLVQEFRKNLYTSRMVLYLLSFQAFLFVTLTLVLMVNISVNTSSAELATLISRGAGRFQILFLYASEMLIIAILAGLILGPLLSWLGLQLWGWFSGEQVTFGLFGHTYQMSLLAVGIGWVASVIALIPATRSNILEWKQSISRPLKGLSWQKRYFDLFLLILGILLYWQLTNTGSFVMNTISGSEFADPLLLIGPTILLTALAVLFLRLFPYLLNFLSLLASSRRDLVLPLSFTRMTRNLQRVAWIILLISLASGLILFARIYSDALLSSQIQIAEYQAGANLRLNGNKIPNAHFAEIKSVLPASEVLRGRAQETSGRGITILAVDPNTLKDVSEYPAGMTNLTIDLIMDAINPPRSTDIESYNDSSKITEEIIPAVFSYSLIPKDGQIGDHRDLIFSGSPVTFEIRGMIADFPTLTKDFVIVDANKLAQVIGPHQINLLKNREYWIRTGEAYHQQLLSFDFIKNAVLADSQVLLTIIQHNIMTMGTVRAFSINGIFLFIISLVGILVVNYFSYRKSDYEFGILRAFGFSRQQSYLLIASEGIIVLFLGAFSGIILGYSLTILMRPYISLAVSRTLPGMMVYQINFNWFNAAVILGLLATVYIFAMGIIFVTLSKSKIHQVIRAGDE
jgi:ABC-type antimicrobial peptide transport system permease subunit